MSVSFISLLVWYIETVDKSHISPHKYAPFNQQFTSKTEISMWHTYEKIRNLYQSIRWGFCTKLNWTVYFDGAKICKNILFVLGTKRKIFFVDQTSRSLDGSFKLNGAFPKWLDDKSKFGWKVMTFCQNSHSDFTHKSNAWTAQQYLVGLVSIMTARIANDYIKPVAWSEIKDSFLCSVALASTI